MVSASANPTQVGGSPRVCEVPDPKLHPLIRLQPGGVFLWAMQRSTCGQVGGLDSGMAEAAEKICAEMGQKCGFGTLRNQKL